MKMLMIGEVRPITMYDIIAHTLPCLTNYTYLVFLFFFFTRFIPWLEGRGSIYLKYTLDPPPQKKKKKKKKKKKLVAYLTCSYLTTFFRTVYTLGSLVCGLYIYTLTTYEYLYRVGSTHSLPWAFVCGGRRGGGGWNLNIKQFCCVYIQYAYIYLVS